MNDLITLSNSTKRTPKSKDFNERESQEQHGKKRYQERLIQDREAKKEIKDYERDKENPNRVY